jgi:hypothetical protein
VWQTHLPICVFTPSSYTPIHTHASRCVVYNLDVRRGSANVVYDDGACKMDISLSVVYVLSRSNYTAPDGAFNRRVLTATLLPHTQTGLTDTQTNAHTHALTGMFMCVCSLDLIWIHSHTYTLTHIYTHTHTHTYTHTHTHTLTHTHAHTYTHTHLLLYTLAIRGSLQRMDSAIKSPFIGMRLRMCVNEV